MSSNLPSVSIVTVAYNSAQTIADTINSVAAQDYPSIQHIVVDGASSDGTVEVVRGCTSANVELVSEKDDGIYDAINKGIKLASGDIIGILNSDDLFAENDVVSAVAKAMHNEALDVLYGDVAFVRGHNLDQPVRRFSSRRFSPERIEWGWMPAHPALFVRRGIYSSVGEYKTNFHIASDFDMVARIFKINNLKFRYMPRVMVMMRLGGVSTGGFRNTILLNKEVYRALRENNYNSNWLKILSKYPAKLLEFLHR